MEDKFWEENLRSVLEGYKPEGLQPEWEAFSNYLHVHEQISEWEQDEAFDESIKESVSEFEPTSLAEGWDRVESSLKMADQQFDEHIRNKINQFEPRYNPGYWSLFMQRLSGVAYLRAKLIAFKIVEVAAVFLLLFTALKMGQMGKLPFETPLFEKQKETTTQRHQNVEIADNSSQQSNQFGLNSESTSSVNESSAGPS